MNDDRQCMRARQELAFIELAQRAVVERHLAACPQCRTELARLAGTESIRKLLEHEHTADAGAGITGAALGTIGNQLMAQYKPGAGKRINPATLIACTRHSWPDALSSAGRWPG